MKALLVFLVLAATAAANTVLGVSPADQVLYSNAEFTCRDKEKTIPIANVNDDYCDCADGSDEPGTSACTTGSFYCANRLYKPSVLPSSRVNDGVCDCCDGTDENNGVTSCQFTCKEIGEAWRAEMREKQRTLLEGAKKKAEYVELGKASRKERETKLDEVKAKVDALQPELDSLKEKKDAADRLKKIAEARLKRLQEEKEAEEKAAAAAEAEANGEVAETEEAVDSDAGVSTEGEVADDKKEEDAVEIISTFETEEEGEEGLKLVPPGKEDEFIDDAQRATTAWQEVKDEVDKLERERRDLEGDLTKDLGPDDEYFPLLGKCYSSKDLEYEWEVCPFDKSSQKSLSGGSPTGLGKWGRWSVPHSKMMLENGQTCWQGPARSMEVTFVCGKEDALLSVEEPAKCTYTSVFSTPAACNVQHAEVEAMNMESIEEHY